WPCRRNSSCERIPICAAPPRQRIWQLYQDCAAHPGQDCNRSRPARDRPAATRHVRHRRNQRVGQQKRRVDFQEKAVIAMAPNGLDRSTLVHVPAVRPFRLKLEVKPNPYVGTLGVFLGAGLATLSGRLLSVALPDLRGALGLGVDEAAWLPTAYNMTLMFM